MMSKRFFDFVFSLIGILFLLPLFLCVSVFIILDSTGPVFFRQKRVGRYGRIFFIHKFRTMVVDAELHGSQITVRNDSRITRVGSFLRLSKIDELPQLFDVLVGNMSFVGPRPEVPFFIRYYPEDVREAILALRPGITDNASIHFRHESSLLANSVDPLEKYVNEILPVKLSYNLNYARNQSFFGDIVIILMTFKAILFPKL